MRPVRKADNLPPSCDVVTKIWEPLTSCNPLGLSRPVMGLLYLYLYLVISCTVWHLKMGPSVSPETSVSNYQPTPRINNITELNENCTFGVYYAASSGNSLPKFRDRQIGPIFKGQEPRTFWILDTYEDGIVRFSRNVDKEVPLLAA